MIINGRYFIIEEKPHSTFPGEPGDSFAVAQSVNYYEWATSDGMKKINVNDNPCIKEISYEEFSAYNAEFPVGIGIYPNTDYKIEPNENGIFIIYVPDDVEIVITRGGNTKKYSPKELLS